MNDDRTDDEVFDLDDVLDGEEDAVSEGEEEEEEEAVGERETW